MKGKSKLIFIKINLAETSNGKHVIKHNYNLKTII